MSKDFFFFLIHSRLFLGDEMEDKLKEIILDNRNLIYSVIHRFKGSDYDDLFQAGCLGLVKAYKNYKSNSTVKFTSYAYPYIVGEIYKFIINNRNIHMSPMNMKLLNSMNKASIFLTNQLGRIPTDSELASFMEIDLYKLSELKNMMGTDSLDYNYDNYDLYDFLEEEEIPKDLLIDLKSALCSLSNKEKLIIKERYFNNLTQNELARKYNTNQVKISRDEKKILLKLKAKMY